VFANAAAIRDGCALKIRVTASGEADDEAHLTLTVTAP